MIPAGAISPNASAVAENFDQLYLWSISLIAALGGLLFGYDWVVIGGAKPFYEAYFQLATPAQHGWAMSCALIGCLLGAGASGVLSDHFGRKRMLILAGLTFTASSLGTGLAGNIEAFVVWRIAGGVAIGLASSLSPMYIAEIAPAHLRGKLVSVNQLTIVIGLVLAQGINWLIARPLPAQVTQSQILHSWDGQLGWRWMFGVTAIPATVFLVAMFCVPESPRWLATKKKQGEALRILARVGGSAYGDRVLQEIDETLIAGDRGVGLGEFLVPRIFKPTLLGIALAVLQQWCGINVIFNYAQEVFAAAGYSLSSMLSNIVVTGLVMLVFTFIAIHTVDRKGRRTLMLTGCAGLADTWETSSSAVIGVCLFRARTRNRHVAARGSGHRCVRDDVGSDNLGTAFRDFSQPRPGRRYGDRHHVSMGCVLRSHLHISLAESKPWAGEDILDLCRYLHSGVLAREQMRA